MARQLETSQEEKLIQVRVQKETRNCDKCNKSIDQDAMNEEFANELIILLNAQECVSSSFRRDYCTDCLEIIWKVICEAIKADPDDISGYEDEQD